MKIKRLFLFVAAAAVLLAACNPQNGTQAVPAATAPAPAATGAATQSATLVASGPASCTAVSVLPTPGPTETSLFPPPSKEDWVNGPENALVTFTEYSDFQCPYCAGLAPVLEQVHKDNPDKVRVVFRHFPLPGHPYSLITAQAAEAAGLQNKFWEMHDAIFTGQQEWSLMESADVQAWLVAKAGELGLDVQKFTGDLTSETIVAKVKAAQDNGQKVGIPGTPFLLINGKPYQGPRDAATLSGLIKLVELVPRQYTRCPDLTINAMKSYLAVLTTDKGDIILELYPKQAPVAVNSFVFLARAGWFDGVPFHTVLPGVVAQTGDPTGTGFGGPGYFFDDEISPDLTFDQPGMVGMANSGPGSNGSQFFITFSAMQNLDGKYTVFGKVVSGLDVAMKLTPRDPSSGSDITKADQIKKVTIQEK